MFKEVTLIEYLQFIGIVLLIGVTFVLAHGFLGCTNKQWERINHPTITTKITAKV